MPKKMSGLRKIRVDRGLTQVELAEDLYDDHRMQSRISAWERGKIRANIETIERIADALDCDVEELID